MTYCPHSFNKVNDISFDDFAKLGGTPSSGNFQIYSYNFNFSFSFSDSRWMAFSLDCWGSSFCLDVERIGKAIAVAMEKVIKQRRYHVVLDLNGVLVWRGVYCCGIQLVILVRPGSKPLLEFIQKSAELSFWPNVSARNVEPMLDVLLHGASFLWTDITILT